MSGKVRGERIEAAGPGACESVALTIVVMMLAAATVLAVITAVYQQITSTGIHRAEY